MTFAKFMAKHYYITAVLVVLTFGYTVVMPIVRWTTTRSERQFREDLEATLLSQNVRIHELQAMLVDRLQILEGNQRKILKTLEELKESYSHHHNRV